MLSDLIYVPIVKWKQGEQEALRELCDSVKDKIIPLIEITPDLNFSKFKNTLSNWENRYFYFDVLPEVYEVNGGEIYFELLKECDPNYVIPVVLLSDDKDVIKDALAYSNNGIAVRLTNNDFEGLESNLNELEKEVDINNVDLIIDLRELTENNIAEKKIIIKAILPDIPNIQSFRNIIISCSSFPYSLSNLEKYKIHYINRLDYHFWKSLISYETKYGIRLIYSDYCINHPNFFEYIPGMNPSFNIRYTTENSYIIIRGNSIKKDGLDVENVSSLCKKLISIDDFNGPDFSWGDNYIYTRCGKDVKGCGNLTTWRKVGTNHHITFVVNQLSNLL